MDLIAAKEEPKIDLRQAIIMLSHAWEKVTAETISNCWRKTNILPFGEAGVEELQAEVDGLDDLKIVASELNPLGEVEDYMKELITR